MSFVKKHYKLIILILVIFIIYVIFKTTNHNNITYTALGDAYALGVDSYERIDYGYSDYFKDYLSSQHELKFYTKDFATKEMSIDKLYSAIITNKKVQSSNKKLNLKEIIRESDILTLTVGINDLLYKISITPNLTTEKLEKILQEVNSSFNELIELIKQYYPNNIYFIGYYESNFYNKYLNYSVKKLNKLISENPHIIFISTEELFKEKSYLTSNPNLPYPNSRGYKEIANLIIKNLNTKKKKIIT